MKKFSMILSVALLASCASNHDQEVTEMANEVSNVSINKSKFKMVSNDMMASNGFAFDSNAVPASAKAGECFTKVMSPAIYKYSTEKVMVTPESTTYRNIPARYKLVNKTVTVREASEKLVTIPATYKYVTSKVMSKEASSVMTSVPAKFKTVSERIMVSPAKSIWKRGEPTKVNENGILCKVKIPAKFKTVYKKVLVQDSKTLERNIPAEFKTVKTRVVNTPATVKTIVIPSVTKTIQVKEVVEPARRVPVTHNAKFQSVAKKVLVKAPLTKWAPILCKTNAHPGNIQKVQKALKLSGYNPGELDGVIGTGTARAINSFQKANKLSTGGLTLETLKALNVKL